jgi:hypothetical protein
MNGTHLLLVYADHVNLLCKNKYTIKKSRESLLETSREVGLNVNTQKNKYVAKSRHQSAAENHDLQTAKTSFENVKLTYLGTTVKVRKVKLSLCFN